MRAKIHYLLAFVILSFYGGAVCPFIESLGLVSFSTEIGVIFLLGWALRSFLIYKFQPNFSLNLPSWQYKLELFIFFFIGIVVMIFNFAFYHFPLGSGVKVIVGAICASHFIGSDLALQKEIEIYHLLQNRTIEIKKITSTIAKTFSIFASYSILLMTLVLLLVIAKDFQWISNLKPDDLKHGIVLSLVEIFFVLLVFLFWTLNLILSFSRNLKLFFAEEVKALQSAISGKLDTFVPVVRYDEFGLMASYTNEMILELKEKQRIKEIFGKIVSPEVSNRLLQEGLDREGKEELLVVAFIDIRNFTSISEVLEPTQLVRNLNNYFTEIVSIIHKNKGEVDKFIGDGILAFWGLSSQEKDFIQNAVYTGFEILEAKHKLQKELDIPLEIGIGMDYGKVIAGNIGSLQRLEFTVIGNTVNTASRLEGLCKEINSPFVISERLYNMLTSQTKFFQQVGEFKLKGKANLEKVYAYKDETLEKNK
jgi:adenylate cyclase